MATDMSNDADPTPDDPLQAGLEQFQRAALEAIRAGRAMLDAAESVVQDPRAAEALVRTVTDVARTATETGAGFAGRARPAPRGDDEHPPEDEPGDGFERIRVD
jgi:hypothetical protein